MSNRWIQQAFVAMVAVFVAAEAATGQTELADTASRPSFVRLSAALMDEARDATPADRAVMFAAWAEQTLGDGVTGHVLAIAPDGWKPDPAPSGVDGAPDSDASASISDAELVLIALAAVRELQPRAEISVYGLPLREAEPGWEAVEAELDLFVTSHSLILAGTRQQEAHAIRRAVPRAFEISRGRPILFRTNHLWRVITPGIEVEEDAPEPTEDERLDLEEIEASSRPTRASSDEEDSEARTRRSSSASAAAVAAPSSGSDGSNGPRFGSGGGGGGGGGSAGGGSGGGSGGSGSGGGGSAAVPGLAAPSFVASGPPKFGVDREGPVFFTWHEPKGNAVFDDRIIQLVQVGGALWTPAYYANDACDKILTRRLRRGEIAIFIRDFGMGGAEPGSIWENVATPLFSHWSDGLDPSLDHFWMTPWMSNGIATCRPWMEQFIAQYKARQAENASIPSPDRFHFDSETWFSPVTLNDGALEIFDAVRADPRWATEEVGGLGKTMDQLYAEAGSPPYDDTLSAFAPENLAWRTWYIAVLETARAHAMNEVAYSLIREAWPECKSSNFNEFAHQRDDGDALKHGSRRSFADLHAPAIYGLMPFNQRSVEAAIDSWEGSTPREVTPWVMAPGTSGGSYESATFQEVVQMAYDLGVREFLVWGNRSVSDTRERWNELASFVNQLD